MFKKLFIGIFCILLLSGCSYKEREYDINTIYYDLNISNYYKENIVFTLPSNAYELAESNINVDYDSLEYILLIDNFSRPIHNNLYTLYGKRITRLKDAIEVDLDFDYIESDFVQSNYMNTCFEKHSLKNEDDYFEIHLSGAFYCLQDKEMTIRVSSIYSDEETNGTRVGDAFQWVINPYNANDVSIYYKVYRNKRNMATAYGTISNKSNTEVVTIVEFIIIMIVLGVGFIFYKNLYHHTANKKR